MGIMDFVKGGVQRRSRGSSGPERQLTGVHAFSIRDSQGVNS
jgi:hypothetical protein